MGASGQQHQPAAARKARTPRTARGHAELVADSPLLSDAPVGDAARREILSATLGLPESVLDELSPEAGERLLERLVQLSARVRRLEAEAALDDLTGSLRRGVGLRLVQAEIDRVRRSRGRLVVAFVDVDGLKRVNDTQGHEAGDRLLQLVARTLRRRLRSYDLVVRYGGDEFLCALSGAGAEEARAKLAVIAAELHSLPGHPSISVGLAELDAGAAGADAGSDSAAALVGRADAALYRSRQARPVAR
jgi:diguanylate cyclase (GGDEF)-like protein